MSEAKCPNDKTLDFCDSPALASFLQCANCALRPAWRAQRCIPCYFWRRRHNGEERPEVPPHVLRKIIAEQTELTEQRFQARIDVAYHEQVLRANRVRVVVKEGSLAEVAHVEP